MSAGPLAYSAPILAQSDVTHVVGAISIDQCPRAHFSNAPALARDLEAPVIELRFVLHNPSTLSSAHSFCVYDRIS